KYVHSGTHFTEKQTNQYMTFLFSITRSKNVTRFKYSIFCGPLYSGCAIVHDSTTAINQFRENYTQCNNCKTNCQFGIYDKADNQYTKFCNEENSCNPCFK